MNGFLNGLVGGGLAFLLAGVAWIIAKHRHHAPGFGIDDWIFVACTAAMVLAGDLAVSTGLGQWVTGIIRGIANYFGDFGVIVIALVTLYLLVKTVLALFRKHKEDGVLRLAFALPTLLAFFPAGDFHKLSVALSGPANSVALALAHGMGIS